MTDSTTAPAPAPDHVLSFLDDIHFATIATIDPDGAPRQAVIWYTLDGGDIILNSAVGRRWPANLQRDARVSVAITDRHDGYRWVGFSSQVSAVITDQPSAQADIAGMARRYHADEPEEAEALIRDRFERQARISFRIPVVDVHDHLG